MTIEELLSLEKTQAHISELRAELDTLLKEEQRLLTKRAADEGCTCGFMILGGRVERLSNHYCKAVHRLHR